MPPAKDKEPLHFVYRKQLWVFSDTAHTLRLSTHLLSRRSCRAVPLRPDRRRCPGFL